MGPDSAHRDARGTRKWLSERTPESYREEMRRCDFVVAEDDSSVVGFGAIDVKKGEITSVYVDPGFTRRGIGSAIVRALETEASRAGLLVVTLHAAGGALDFYKKIGYSYDSPPRTPPRWATMRKKL
jgi:ribosomal protein S18 acetylase RimI-like enzyme